MTKVFVDELISNMKKAGIVTKAASWMVEGMDEKAMHVRYVGVKPFNDWIDIIPGENNLLIKFVTGRAESFFELYLANKPPFLKIVRRFFSANDKWETLLGEVKRQLSKDKEDVISHNEKLGNLYTLIKPHLK